MDLQNEKIFNYKKMNKKNLLISVVALIEVILLLIVSTYSWIEKTSSLQILGEGDIDNNTYSIAEMYTANTNYKDKTISLDKYFRASGNVHLVPAKSTDGVNFQFKKLKSGASTTEYRNGNINDKNVNYISFSFKVKAMEKDTEFYFENIPTIKVGGKAISASENNNSVRFAITAGGTTAIYSNSNSSNPTIHSFSEYTYKTDSTAKPLFLVKKDAVDIVTISMWLDESATNYANNPVEVTGFKILAKEKQGFKINAAYAKDCNNTMGEISVTNVISDETKTTATLVATEKEAYRFVGWYKNKDCTGDAANTNMQFNASVTADTTYYAKYEKKIKISVGYVTNCNTYGTVYVTDDTSKTYVYVEKNASVELKYSAKAGYGFAGWYEAEDGLSGKLSGNTVTATADKTYFAKFVPTVTISAGLTDNCTYTMGSVTVDGKTGSADVAKDTKVKLKATANKGYEFVGWFEKSDESGSAVSNSAEYEVTADKTKSYYAKFKKVVYLDLTKVDWEKDGAIIAYHTWDGGNPKWVFMSDNDGDSIYTADYPEGYTGILFARLAPGSTVSNATIWNQTADLRLEDNKNYCTITNMNGGYTWVAYS